MVTQCISTDALAVLREIECDSDRARITSGQLERPLYEEVNEILVRLGGKWKSGRTKAHLFPYYDPRPLLAGVIATGDMPPKNPLAFFPTPARWVDYVMDIPLWNDVREGDSVLEPSAGFGALAEGMRKRLAPTAVQIDCCEMLPINQRVLRDKGFDIVASDFLTYQPQKRYRAIIMNPPFSLETDRMAFITHIQHAWDLLAYGGFLVAFAPSGYTFRSDKKSSDFLSFVLMYGDWEELPAKSFHESGTDSVITLMTLKKQDQSWRYCPYNGCPSWFCWNLVLLADSDDAFFHVQQRIIGQLNRGDLCADPRLLAWKQTQEAIRDYYQRVIADARKNSQQHLDIRSQDWPFLERKFMEHWDDGWEVGVYSQEGTREAAEREVPVVVEAVHEAVISEETPALLDDEAKSSASMRPGAEVEPAISSFPRSIGTSLYSPLSCDASLSYEQLSPSSEETDALSRDCYPPLPWCMEEVVSTIWRNIHTGEAKRVHHLGTNRFGKPVLCTTPATPPMPFGQDLEIIGFWSGDRYLVEQWVRVDLQCEEAQLCWFGVELAWLRSQTTCCEHKIAEYRWDTTNRNLQKRVKKEYQLQLQRAEASMRDFAAGYDLSIPLEVLNSGIGVSEQMAMF